MSEPVTRADLDSVLTKVADQMNERLDRMETNLLTAFHSWARTHELRERGSIDTLANLRERLHNVEDRIAEAERQLREQRPPAA